AGAPFRDGAGLLDDRSRRSCRGDIMCPDGKITRQVPPLYFMAALPKVYGKSWRVEMKIEGNCHCGAIAWEAEVDPARAAVCHCADGKTRPGAPFRASVPAKAEDFHILKGQPRVYVKTAESGNRRAQGFCADCGSPIYAANAEAPKVYNLRLGGVKQ